MSFNLSVVNIIPDTYLIEVNQIASIYGCGDNNLSVKLTDNNGNIFWGCHSQWKPEHYAIFTDQELRSQLITPDLLISLEFLYERLVLDGNAQENWTNALLDLGLTLVEEI